MSNAFLAVKQQQLVFVILFKDFKFELDSSIKKLQRIRVKREIKCTQFRDSWDAVHCKREFEQAN